MPKVNNLDLDVLVEQIFAIKEYAIDYGEYSPISGIFLYRYYDAPKGHYERVAFVINEKLHWLDLRGFELSELRGVAECVNVAINSVNEKWGIYPKGSFVTHSKSSFVVFNFHRDIDLIEQLPKALSKLSEAGSDNLEWEVSMLAEEYDLYDYDECDEDYDDDYEYYNE